MIPLCDHILNTTEPRSFMLVCNLSSQHQVWTMVLALRIWKISGRNKYTKLIFQSSIWTISLMTTFMCLLYNTFINQYVSRQWQFLRCLRKYDHDWILHLPLTRYISHRLVAGYSWWWSIVVEVIWQATFEAILESLKPMHAISCSNWVMGWKRCGSITLYMWDLGSTSTFLDFHLFQASIGLSHRGLW